MLQGVFVLLSTVRVRRQSTALNCFQHNGIRWCLLVLVCCLVAWPLSPAQGQDLRVRVGTGAPEWSRAIVKIRVPVTRSKNGYPKHFFEYCTGTRVRAPDSKQIHILTAWHCFDGYNRHLDQAEVQSADLAWHPTTLSRSGGSMTADWAWLNLPNTLSPDPALRFSDRDARPTDPLIAAGFSRDAGIGDHGNTLTYDPHCQLQPTDAPRGLVSSDCIAFKGASGGPVLITTDSGWMVAAIISAAMNNVSLLVPTRLIATP